MYLNVPVGSMSTSWTSLKPIAVEDLQTVDRKLAEQTRRSIQKRLLVNKMQQNAKSSENLPFFFVVVDCQLFVLLWTEFVCNCKIYNVNLIFVTKNLKEPNIICFSSYSFQLIACLFLDFTWICSTLFLKNQLQLTLNTPYIIFCSSYRKNF